MSEWDACSQEIPRRKHQVQFAGTHLRDDSCSRSGIAVAGRILTYRHRGQQFAVFLVQCRRLVERENKSFLAVLD